MGKRYIESYPSVANFPIGEDDGTMAWAEDEQAMYYRGGNAWQPFGGGGSIFNALTYDTVKVVDRMDIGDVYEDIVTLTTPARAAGKYVVGYSLTYDFPDVNDTVYIRWRIDGGAWNEFRAEPNDITDKIARYYEFPADYQAGVHTVDFQMKKSDVQAAELDLRYLDIFFQRVG